MIFTKKSYIFSKAIYSLITYKLFIIYYYSCSLVFKKSKYEVLMLQEPKA